MQDGIEKTRAIRRSTLIGIVIFAVFGILLLRILLIQTVDFEKYQQNQPWNKTHCIHSAFWQAEQGCW